MRKRNRIIVVAIVAVAGGLACLVALRPAPEPADLVYAGHSLSEWVGGKFNSANSLDSNAVPYFIQSLKRREGAMGRAYTEVSLSIDLPGWLEKRLPIPNYAMLVRFNSCQLLNGLGTNARPAIPELIRVLQEDEDQSVRAVAAGALGQIANREDKQAVNALGVATKDKNATVARRAGEALSHITNSANGL